MTLSSWTHDPPNVPGPYRCRFLDADPEPFEVDAVLDTFNGGVAVKGKRSRGICLLLSAYERCEWKGPLPPAEAQAT